MKSIRHLAAAALLVFAAVLAAPAQAGVLLDYGENKVLDWLLRGQSFTPPTTQYWALGTNACSDSSSPTEPSGSGYARIAYSASLANWSGTQSTASTAASSGTGGSISNNAAITFATSTGSWGTLVSVWLMDASSSGNAIACITLTSSVSVAGSGYTVSFPAASLVISLD